jgi:hypothetical protein
MLEEINDQIIVLFDMLDNFENNLLNESNLYHWSPHGDSFKKMVSHLIDVTQTEITNDNKVSKLPGVMTISKSSMGKAKSINNQKDLVKSLIIKNMSVSSGRTRLINQMSGVTNRKSKIGNNKSFIALKGVSLIQVYRHITCVDDHVKSISFTWASSNRAVKRISFAEAQDLILKNALDDNRELYLDMISHYPNSLAIVKPVKHHLKANIKTVKGGLIRRIGVMAHSPIMIEEENVPPVVKWPGEYTGKLDRIVRSDLKIGRDALIPEFNIYIS